MGESAIRCAKSSHLAFAAALFAGVALADENSAKCTNQDAGFSLIQQIDGCTAIIQSRHPSKKYLASALFLRGKAYYEIQDYDRAIADYRDVVRLDSEFTAIFFRRGLAYYKKRDYARAIADFNSAIKLNPQDAQSFNSRGLAYRGKRDYDRAIVDFSKAVSLDPKLAYGFSNRGDAYFDKQDYERAIADYSEAIRLDPRHASAFCNRGAVYSLKKDYNRSASDYGDAIRLDPKDAHSALNLYLARARSDPSNALAELAADAKNLNQSHWPYAVVELFLGSRTPEATLAASTDPGARCEAQSYIGEWRLLHGDSAALASLKEASDACSKSPIENLSVRSALLQLRQDVNALAPAPEPPAPPPIAKPVVKPEPLKEAAPAKPASRETKGEARKPNKQAALGFSAFTNKVTCAISANLGKITSLLFDPQERRGRKQSRQCQ